MEDGGDFSNTMIQKTVKDLEEEVKRIAADLYKLLKIPDCYASLSACNDDGHEALFIVIHTKDADGKDIKISKEHYDFYAPDEWQTIYKEAYE